MRFLIELGRRAHFWYYGVPTQAHYVEIMENLGEPGSVWI